MAHIQSVVLNPNTRSLSGRGSNPSLSIQGSQLCVYVVTKYQGSITEEGNTSPWISEDKEDDLQLSGKYKVRKFKIFPPIL